MLNHGCRDLKPSDPELAASLRRLQVATHGYLLNDLGASLSSQASASALGTDALRSILGTLSALFQESNRVLEPSLIRDAQAARVAKTARRSKLLQGLAPTSLRLRLENSSPWCSDLFDKEEFLAADKAAIDLPGLQLPNLLTPPIIRSDNGGSKKRKHTAAFAGALQVPNNKIASLPSSAAVPQESRGTFQGKQRPLKHGDVHHAHQAPRS